MNQDDSKCTVDAVSLQERDEFSAAGWVKAIAPAKVNLHLGVGARRDDGYHEVCTVMHAVNLHDVVYLRRKLPDAPDYGSGIPLVRMVSIGDVVTPAVASEDNLAARAVMRLAEALGRPAGDTELEIRIEKNIPSQAGLGGGSSDAAAALIGAARVWGCDDDSEVNKKCEEVAQQLGADVAFFLHGGCAHFEGAGELFACNLEPLKSSIALVKPEGGVSTAAAYQLFDEQASPDAAASKNDAVRAVEHAQDIALFNNLAAASEQVMPELAEVRSWLEEQPGVQGALLCGSGAATFALCDDFAAACNVVGGARKRGWWARSSSLGSLKATIV